MHHSGLNQMPENPYEKQNRFKKATLIADTIDKSSLTIEQIDKLSIRERDIIATLAGVKNPSEATWNIVLELVKKRKADPLVG